VLRPFDFAQGKIAYCVLRVAYSVSTRQTALALFLLASIVYHFPLAYNLLHKPFFNYAPGQDVASTSLLPIEILERGDFALDKYREFYKRFYHDPYFVAEVNGRLVSRSPVAAAVLAVPFYGLPLGMGWIANPRLTWLVFPWSGYVVAKFAAAFITALGAVMFFFCARELADLRTSASLTLALAFGTSVWSTATQGLWQQTPSILFQVIAIWFLLRGRRRGADAVAPAAFFLSAATIARPNNGIAALLFTFYVLLFYRSAFWRWIIWAIPPALFFFAYNAIYNGSPFVFGYQDGVAQYIITPQLDALLGLFVSPSRGLLVYSPFLVFALLRGLPAHSGGRAVRPTDSERLFYWFAASVFALNVLFVSTFKVWDGGWGYGTRNLVDVLPYAVLLLVPTFTRLRGAWLAAFWVMVAYAAIVQSFGLWDYGERWHWHWENYNYDVWNIAENEPLFYLREYLRMAQSYLSGRGFR
jgi:hypothetical protein